MWLVASGGLLAILFLLPHRTVFTQTAGLSIAALLTAVMIAGLRRETGLSLCMRDTMPESGWQRRFQDPILLPDESHSIRCVMPPTTSPACRMSHPTWRSGKSLSRRLTLVARSGPTMLARIAFMKALNRNVVLAFNPDAKKHHRGKRKLKRDQ